MIVICISKNVHIQLTVIRLLLRDSKLACLLVEVFLDHLDSNVLLIWAYLMLIVKFIQMKLRRQLIGF
jgi:hypothetical protein